jgi:UDP-N-acetylmuramoyl-tripeptide--D-alanyl-D-alanine ligase
VVSEMLELGDSSAADHVRTGELAAQAGADLVIAIGSGTAPAARAAAEAGVTTIELADADAALSLLDSPDCPLRRADAVLVKGSHGSGAWRIADRLQEGVKEMDAR